MEVIFIGLFQKGGLSINTTTWIELLLLDLQGYYKRPYRPQDLAWSAWEVFR